MALDQFSPALSLFDMQWAANPPPWWFGAPPAVPVLLLSQEDGAFALTTSEDTVTISMEEPAAYAGDYVVSIQAISLGPVFISGAQASGASTIGAEISVLEPLWLQSAAFPMVPPSYQWFSDSSSIAGATNQTFTTTAAEAGTVVTRQTTVTVNGVSATDVSNGISVEAPVTGFTRAGANNNGSAHFDLQSNLGLTGLVGNALIFFSFRLEAKQSGALFDTKDAGIFTTGSTTHRIGAFVEDDLSANVIAAGSSTSEPIEIGDTINHLVAVQAGGASQVYVKINNGPWSLEYDTTNTAAALDFGNNQFGVLAEDVGNGNGVVHVTLYRSAIWLDVAALPDISDGAVQDVFCDNNGVILDPATSHTAYGDAASGALRFDFHGDATAANAGTHTGAAGAGTINSSGGFTNAS